MVATTTSHGWRRVELTQPTLVAAVPGFGPTAGGNSVMPIGTNLGGATSVTFGGTPAAIVSQDLFGFLITVTAPPHAAGNVPVVVTTAAGSASVADGFTYVGLPLPTAVSITPAVGPVVGGTPITIIGTNLTGVTVTIGGAPATSVAVDVTGTVLTAVTLAGVAGNAEVVVTTPAGSVTVTGGFTYV